MFNHLLSPYEGAFASYQQEIASLPQAQRAFAEQALSKQVGSGFFQCWQEWCATHPRPSESGHGSFSILP